MGGKSKEDEESWPINNEGFLAAARPDDLSKLTGAAAAPSLGGWGDVPVLYRDFYENKKAKRFECKDIQRTKHE